MSGSDPSSPGRPSLAERQDEIRNNLDIASMSIGELKRALEMRGVGKPVLADAVLKRILA